MERVATRIASGEYAINLEAGSIPVVGKEGEYNEE
jgi:hypothetical protein